MKIGKGNDLNPEVQILCLAVAKSTSGNNDFVSGRILPS